MQINDEASIKKHLSSGQIKSLYLIYGDESYLATFYANNLASSVADTSGMSFDYYYFDAETIDFQSFYEASESIPMLSEKVCIFVKDFPFTKLSADEMKMYLEYFPKMPESTVAIFLMANIEVDVKLNQKWKSVLEAFDRSGVIFCLSKRTDAQVAELLVRSAGKRGTSVSRENAEYFVSVAGNEMTVLLNEFDKLCAFSQGQEITREMIDTITTRSVEASVFDLTTAINSGKNDRAFEILTELIKNKTEATLIIGTLAFGYVDIYRARVARDNSMNNRDIVNAFASYKGKSFRLDKALTSARSLSLTQIKELVNAVADADIKIKSFSVDNKTVLEELVARLLYIAGGRK